MEKIKGAKPLGRTFLSSTSIILTFTLFFLGGICSPVKAKTVKPVRPVKPLKAGVAVDFLKIPVGTPTGGYGQKEVEDDPKSPYADKFPATRGIHTKLKVKALALDNGDTKVNIVRIDAIGISDQFAQKVIKEVRGKTKGKLDVSENLVLCATHTHAGPGRLSSHPLWAFAMDTFSQELLNQVVDKIAEVIIRANENLEPAKIGFGKGKNEEISGDRRCENPPLKDPTMWVMRIDKAGGAPLAVIINFALHGTVLGSENHYFSVDAPGLIEEKMEERFSSPLVAMYIQSAAGDIAPRDPKGHKDEWDGMEEIGLLGALTAIEVYNSIKTTSRVDLEVVNMRVPLNREALGYKKGEFPHKYGAGLCGLMGEACDGDYVKPNPGMKICGMVGNKKSTISQTRLTALKLGDYLMVTLPGEPLCSLGIELREKIKKEVGFENILIWGYSQDHLGYLLLPDDWWQGGYEAAMNLWGWKLGRYLIEKSTFLAKQLTTKEREDNKNPEVEKLALYKDEEYSPIKLSRSIKPGEPAKSPVVLPGRSVSFSWYGGDSGVDYPQVVVETYDGKKWKSLKRKNGLPFDDSTYETFLNYKVKPTYKEDKDKDEREFLWEIVWRTRYIVPLAMILKKGSYRFHIQGNYFDGKSKRAYEVTSEAFELEK